MAFRKDGWRDGTRNWCPKKGTDVLYRRRTLTASLACKALQWYSYTYIYNIDIIYIYTFTTVYIHLFVWRLERLAYLGIGDSFRIILLLRLSLGSPILCCLQFGQTHAWLINDDFGYLFYLSQEKQEVLPVLPTSSPSSPTKSWPRLQTYSGSRKTWGVRRIQIHRDLMAGLQLMPRKAGQA